MMGDDAPAYLCITGPNYKVGTIYDAPNPSGKHKPKACIVTDPQGHRHEVVSLNAASKLIGKEANSHTRALGSGIKARGFYLSVTGWRVELAKEKING